MVRNGNQGKKLNNAGAALVTVVVVTAFVSILVTIILYLAGMNYYMKSADKKNKDSFYEAEIAMESIKANLIKESKTAFQDAYKETLITFAKHSATDRELLYNQTFANAIKDSFTLHIQPYVSSGDTRALESYVKTLVPAGYQAGLKVNSTDLEVHADQGYVLLKDVTLEYQKDGYLSKITTDFMIKVPKIDWSIEASAITWGGNPDDLAYKEHEMADCVIYYNWTKE